MIFLKGNGYPFQQLQIGRGIIKITFLFMNKIRGWWSQTAIPLLPEQSPVGPLKLVVQIAAEIQPLTAPI